MWSQYSFFQAFPTSIPYVYTEVDGVSFYTLSTDLDSVLLQFSILDAISFIVFEELGKCACVREWVSSFHIWPYIAICKTHDPIMRVAGRAHRSARFVTHVPRRACESHVPIVPNADHMIAQILITWYWTSAKYFLVFYYEYRIEKGYQGQMISSKSITARTGGIFVSGWPLAEYEMQMRPRTIGLPPSAYEGSTRFG